MTRDEMNTWFAAYSGVSAEEEVALIDNYLENEKQFTTWPTWSYDLTDPKERALASEKVFELFTEYVMFQHINAYMAQFGRGPTLSELCNYTKAANIQVL